MKTAQRKTILVLLAIQCIGSLFALIGFNMEGASFTVRLGSYIGIPFTLSMLILYWRYNWHWIAYVNVLFACIVISLLLLNPAQATSASTALFLPAALAFMMLNTHWTLLIAFLTLMLVLIQSHADAPYREVDQIIVYIIIITCFYFGRRSLERAQHSVEASLKATEAANAELRQYTTATQAQADQLAQQNQAQTSLLELVAALELPQILLGPQTLLVPLVGQLDSRRIQAIIQRLLQTVHQESIRIVILDVAEVELLDTQLVHQLIKLVQTLQLLGTQVTLSGITAEVAQTLATQQLDLSQLRIVQSPDQALQSLQFR